MLNRRNVLKSFGLAGIGGLVSVGVSGASVPVATSAILAQDEETRLKPLKDLKTLTGTVKPITEDERKSRILRAQALMETSRIDAVVVEPGASMEYFCGLRWRRSERLTALVIPRVGDIGVVTPFFEEPSVRETLMVGDDVRPWHEHESPVDKVIDILRDRGMATGVLGLEDTVRYFVFDGLRAKGRQKSIVSAFPVTARCRMIKTDHEITLMKKASEVTIEAYRIVMNRIRSGDKPAIIASMMRRAMSELGGQNGWALVLIGQASAYPHGSDQPQIVKDGEIILMDCGCSVEGYQADISRTFVFGQANGEQRRIFDTVVKGQQVAFEAAKIGRPAGEVDDAVRAYYESLGFGPGYQLPGLSHRTGHGIGMQGHEPINLVHGEKTPLTAGMCFSNEPGIYDFSKFGVRLEDCIYMTQSGPQWFTLPPKSLEEPLGQLAS